MMGEQESQGLSGPQYIPEGKEITSAVVFLHGYGADGNDLISLATILSKALPNTAFFSPDAPEATNMGIGRQWFSDNDFTFVDKPGIEKAKDLLQKYIERLSKEFSLPLDKIAVVSFSQGTMTSLYAVPRFKEKLAGVVGFSGLLMWEEELKERDFHRVPLLLLHGESDDVVHVDGTRQATAKLQQLGFEVEAQTFSGLGHGIDERGLQKASEFLKKTLY